MSVPVPLGLTTPPRAGRLISDVARRHPAVAIGSYPRSEDATFCVLLTLESRDADALRSAHAVLAAAIRVVRADPPP